MASLERTAYPQLRARLSNKELRICYAPSAEEKDFIRCHANGDRQQLTLLVMLKIRQKLGFFPTIDEVPDQLKRFLATAFNLSEITPILNEENQKKTRYRYRQVIRKKLGCTLYIDGGADIIAPIIRNAAHTMSDPADLINVAVEELFNANIELPAFSTLDRLAGHLRQAVHETLYRQITVALTSDQRCVLDQLLEIAEGKKVTDFNRLKQTPGPATLTHVRQWAEHLAELDAIMDPRPFLNGIPHTKIRQFAAEAAALEVSDLRDIRQPGKRHTFLLCHLHQTQSKTRDELVEMFLRRMRRTQITAQEKLHALQEKHRELEEALIGVLGQVLQQAKIDNSDENLGRQVRQILNDQGGVDALDSQYEAVAAYHQNNYLPLLWPIHASNRAVLFRVLELLKIESATQDTCLLKALDFVRQHRHSRRDYLPIEIDLSFASQRWQDFVRKHEKGETVLNRRALEVCVFISIAEALRSVDLHVVGSEAYDDYRAQLLPWDECQQRLGDYCQTVDLPTSGHGFVATLRERLTCLAAEVDARFPENSELTLDPDGTPHLKRQKATKLPDGLKAFEEAVRTRMPERHLLDVLKHVHHWVGYTRHFGPPSGSEPKLSDAIRRYLFTVFGYGCNLGASQTARHASGTINRQTMRRINAQHISISKLEAALNDVIGEYIRFELPNFWGQKTVAIADGTHVELRENNLLGARHIRYGGYGGIAYHHISATYIALFSNFIACGVWEAVYILDGLLQNASELQPDTVHADTHGQSEPVFALASLLGIKLFPRMRTWNDVTFYRPHKATIYQHIDKLFSKTIDWKLIETHWQDMMQVVLSIQAGKVLPSMLLRKLGSHNRKNKLYRAFRELGRVERTLFLLRYVSESNFRQSIRAETTKIESFNDFMDWITFGGPVLKSGDPVEQAKQIKYMNLVANAIMLHNVVDLTDVLNMMASEGFVVTKELISRFSPYIRDHLRRFGHYALDMEETPPPLEPKPVPITG